MRTKGYDFDPPTIGEHIKRRRLLLGMTQKDAAKALQVNQFSILNWETNANQPKNARTLRRIIEFLGYDPLPAGRTIPELLRSKRRQLGLGQRGLAARLDVDPSTITLWEQGGTILKHQHRRLVANLLGIPDCDTRELMRRR